VFFLTMAAMLSNLCLLSISVKSIAIVSICRIEATRRKKTNRLSLDPSQQ
jgi:hypothetical protein